MSQDRVALTGIVATAPKHIITADGLAITSFRLATVTRRLDPGTGSWVDADTNWYTVTAFRQLAVNVIDSVLKGQRVIVEGTLRIRKWETDDHSGVSVEVEAAAIGHDLSFGTASFTRKFDEEVRQA